MSTEAGEKTRWPRDTAKRVATELERALVDACTRIAVAGSLRRGKELVGDIELVYVPRVVRMKDPADLFQDKDVDLTVGVIRLLEQRGVLCRRRNALGRETFGPLNKLMVHAESQIPVDLFATMEACWWNYLVCRTGPAESNVRIAAAARRQGWMWNPTGPGFSRVVPGQGTEVEQMDSEAAVFEWVGLPCPEFQRTKEEKL